MSQPPTDENWKAQLCRRSHRTWDRLAEQASFLVSIFAISMVALIFLFVGREASPVIFGDLDNSTARRVIEPERMAELSRMELQDYLELKPEEYDRLSQTALRTLMIIKAREITSRKDVPDAGINTTEWNYLITPHIWNGYTEPAYVWEPVAESPKYNIVPLLVGSLKVTIISLLFAVPLALGAALYVSQLAGPRVKEWLKPGVELLAGIPSVVLGFFALIVMASALKSVFGYESRLNALVAGAALGLAIIPVIFSIAEDALSSVPRSYTLGALALGASRWEATWKIVLPAALPGVFAAIVLGFGRAIGETMIVWMASGNATILSLSPLDSARTISATIAAELAEAVFSGDHYRVLFLLGTILFCVTFVTNAIGSLIISRLKHRLEGGQA